MNRITLLVLAVVATSGCAAASPDARIETLTQRLDRAERALAEERRANLDLAMGRTSAPAAQPQTTQVEVRGELGMVGSTAEPMPPMPMTAPAIGYVRVASRARVAAPPPWHGQSDAALEVSFHANLQQYALGVIVNGTVTSVSYGDARFPTTLRVSRNGRLVPTRVVPSRTNATVRFLVPYVGPNVVEFTCYAVAAGRGQVYAQWSREVTVPTEGSPIVVSDLTCAAHRIHR